MRRVVCLIIMIFLSVQVIAQSDDIPGNCTHPRGAFFQQNLVPRYNPNSQALDLVDWSSGTIQQSFSINFMPGDYQIQGWSPECQYLTVAFSHLDDSGVERWDSIVFDTVNQTSVTTFADARLSPYPLTWDTNSTQLLVETRFGAYLWKLDGRQVWLTNEADFNARSFQPGSLVWDYVNNQLTGMLTVYPNARATYDMSDGTLISLLSSSGVPLDISSGRYPFATANENGESYACQENRSGRAYLQDIRVVYNPNNGHLVFEDRGTREVVRVIDPELGSLLTDTRMRWASWYVQCRYLSVTFGYPSDDNVIYDLETGQRVLFIEGHIIRQFSIAPTGIYLVATTRNGANLYNLETGQVMPLIPNVRTSSLGSGYVWSFDSIEWDLANNQVRLGSTLSSSIYATYIYQTQIYDLTTGSLVSVIDRNGNPLNEQAHLAIETQRVAPYGCRWRADYQPYNSRLVLQDVVTRDLITVVQDNLVTDDFRYMGRSPDCRYVAAAIWDGAYFDTYVWDLASGTLIDIFEDAQGTQHYLNWSPYGGYVLVNTRNGGILWHLPGNSRVQLNNAANIDNTSTWSPARVYNFYQIEWDMISGQLLAVTVDDATTVRAYDLAMGANIAAYDLGENSSSVRFFLLDDSRLVVYGTRNSGLPDEHQGFALWDRQSGAGIQLAMDFYVRSSQGGYSGTTYPHFNADNSLMLMRSRNYVYVWDLNALVGESPHTPNYTHQVESTRQLEFIDNTRIMSCELTTSREQLARRIDEVTYYIYDAISGELLDTRVETLRFNYWRRPC